MRSSCLAGLLLSFFLRTDAIDYRVDGNVTREGKFFGWGYGVGIVRFENKFCTSNDGLDGTCYTRRQCRELDGTASGLCAGTIGHCCIIQRGCGSTSSHNNTYFVNTNFPMPVTGSTSCTYVIKKCSDEICQVRIDFLHLLLASPDSMGFCIFDSLRITGGASVLRPICGENSGQHIYLGFNRGNDITIMITTSGSPDVARSWNLKVAQIGCDCPTKAPDGCLMYYTALQGTVMSFNYGQTTTGQYYTVTDPAIMRLPGTRELANMNYGICIQMAPGFCAIEWTQTATGSFAVTGSTPAMDPNPDRCDTDYVLIPNPEPPSGTMTPDRFCGNSFTMTTTFSKPFVLYVKTDGVERYNPDGAADNDIGNLGFSLNYRHIPCNPLTMK